MNKNFLKKCEGPGFYPDSLSGPHENNRTVTILSRKLHLEKLIDTLIHGVVISVCFS